MSQSGWIGVDLDGTSEIDTLPDLRSDAALARRGRRLGWCEDTMSEPIEFVEANQKFASSVQRLGIHINLFDTSLAATMQWAEGWLNRAEQIVARMEKAVKDGKSVG